MACQVGIQPGDRLVSVNATILHGLSHSDCLDVLSRPVTNVCLTLLRHRPTDRHIDTDSDTSWTSGDSDTSSELSDDEQNRIDDVHRCHGNSGQVSGDKLRITGDKQSKSCDKQGTSGDKQRITGNKQETSGDKQEMSGEKQQTVGNVNNTPSDGNVHFLQTSTKCCQLSVAALVKSGSRHRTQKFKCKVNDTTTDTKYRHKQLSSKVLAPLTRERCSVHTSRNNAASEEPKSTEVECDSDSTRGSCETSSFTTANSKVPSNSDSSSHYWPAIEQEQEALHGNKLFAQQGPFIYPWRRQFNVFERSLVDCDIPKQCGDFTRVKSHNITEDGGDVSRDRNDNGVDLRAAQRSQDTTTGDTVMTNVASTEDTQVTQPRNDTCPSPVNTPIYENVPVTNVTYSDPKEVELDMGSTVAVTTCRNSQSEIGDLQMPALDDSDYVNVPSSQTSPDGDSVQPDLSCATWSTCGDSTFDDSCAYGDSLTPGQVRVLLTSPFEELERQFDTESTVTMKCQSALNKNTSLNGKYSPKSKYDDRQPSKDNIQPHIGDKQPPMDDRQPPRYSKQPCIDDRQHPISDRQPTMGGCFMQTQLSTEDTSSVQKPLFSMCHTPNVLEDVEDESFTHAYQCPETVEPSVHLMPKAGLGNAALAPPPCEDQPTAMAIPSPPPAQLVDALHTMAAPDLCIGSNLMMMSGTDASLAVSPRQMSPTSQRRQQHIRLMTELKATAGNVGQPFKPATWLIPSTDHYMCPAASLSEQLQQVMCASYTCGADIDGSSLRTDWSDSVSVDTAVAPSENTHQPLSINRSEPVSGDNREEHHSDFFCHPESLSHRVNCLSLTGFPGQVNSTSLTQRLQHGGDMNLQPQSFSQQLPSLSFSQQLFDMSEQQHLLSLDVSGKLNAESLSLLPSQERCDDKMTERCKPFTQSVAQRQKTSQSHNFECATRNDILVLPRTTTKTAGDSVGSAPSQSRDTVSDVNASQNAVTTERVMLHSLSDVHQPGQHCNTVKQRPGSVFSPVVMLHRPHPSNTEGDKLPQPSRSSRHDCLDQILSVTKQKRQNSQGDSYVTFPHPNLCLPPPEVSAVPLRQSNFLGHISAGSVAKGGGLSLTDGSRIFTPDWQPMTAEECLAITVNRRMTQTTSYTPNSKTVTNTHVCTTVGRTVTPLNQPRTTSVDTTDPDFSVIGSYPGVDLSANVSQCVPTTLRKLPRAEEWDDQPSPRLAGNLLPGRRSDEPTAASHGQLRAHLLGSPVATDGTTLIAPSQFTEMLSASHRVEPQPRSAGGCGKRTEDKPFHVQILRSLLGVGISVKVTPNGVVITDIQKTGPVAKNGSVRLV